MTVREIPRWTWLSAGLLVLLLLMILAAGSLSNARRVAIAGSHLDVLDEEQARLSESILKLRYGLVANYDGIDRIVADTLAAKNSLAEGEGAIAAQGNARIDTLFSRYAAALEAHRLHIERFKSGNALLKNSLHYLPSAIDALRRRLPHDAAGQRLAERLGDLSLAALRYGTGADESLAAAVQERAAAIRSDIGGVPPTLRKDVLNALAHADVILEFRPLVDDTTRLIVFPETAPLVRELTQAFQE